MIKKQNREISRKSRHRRIRKKISGTTEIPRLNVYKSNTAYFVQVIDDVKQETLVSASTYELNLKSNNIEAATKVGKLIAERAKEAKIKKVVFDRGGYLYHGKIKALAEAARAEGLEF